MSNEDLPLFLQSTCWFQYMIDKKIFMRRSTYFFKGGVRGIILFSRGRARPIFREFYNLNFKRWVRINNMGERGGGCRWVRTLSHLIRACTERWNNIDHNTIFKDVYLFEMCKILKAFLLTSTPPIVFI